jgi:hypothetical protein
MWPFAATEVTRDMRSWSFLDQFRWCTPAPQQPTWETALPFVKAAHARLASDLARIHAWLEETDRPLRELGGDPLRDRWSSFRPLRLSREEDWSDWLAYLIETSSTGAFWSESLGGRFAAAALARPQSIYREWTLPGGYRADLAIHLRNGSWMHVEVKVGDLDLKKTIGTGQAIRRRVRSANVYDVLLLLSEQRSLWNEVLADIGRSGDPRDDRVIASGVVVLDWHDVARGVRRALLDQRESLTWRLLARIFCGAVEQSLIGLPPVAIERGVTRLSLDDVERLVRYQLPADQRKKNEP